MAATNDVILVQSGSYSEPAVTANVSLTLTYVDLHILTTKSDACEPDIHMVT